MLDLGNNRLGIPPLALPRLPPLLVPLLPPPLLPRRPPPTRSSLRTSFVPSVHSQSLIAPRISFYTPYSLLAPNSTRARYICAPPFPARHLPDGNFHMHKCHRKHALSVTDRRPIVHDLTCNESLNVQHLPLHLPSSAVCVVTLLVLFIYPGKFAAWTSVNGDQT